MVTRAQAKEISGSRRIASIEPGIFDNVPAVIITLESKEVGVMNKQRYTEEEPTFGEDTDGCLLLPTNYRISKRGYWTTLEQPKSGVQGFQFAGHS